MSRMAWSLGLDSAARHVALVGPSSLSLLVHAALSSALRQLPSTVNSRARWRVATWTPA
jgi:hypothetical protein